MIGSKGRKFRNLWLLVGVVSGSFPLFSSHQECLGRSLEGEHSPALTIKDTLQSHSGIHAFNYFLCSLAANVCAGISQARGLVLVALTQSPSFYISLLKRKGLDASLSLRILDCYSDPLGWKEKIGQFSGPDKPALRVCHYVCRDVKDITKMLSSVMELGKGFAEDGGYFAVAIDSVSMMLRYNSLQSVASFISNLRSHGKVSVLLCLLHADLHEPKSTAAFEYMSSIIASLEPMVQITNGQNGSENLLWLGRNLHKGRFHVRFKRRNGRVKFLDEEFHIEQAGIRFATPSENMVVSQTLLPKLQFNLRLSEKEQEDKSRVLLPFEHQGNGEPIQIYDGRRSLAENNEDLNSLQRNALPVEMEAHGMQSKGEIHYIRDSDDDQPDSDEDPDDDLDI
ncbi:elongator complex protein 5 [Phalaenopsis equestris]|uniref:elongator complex protein 5 n=1 Tax=Phalaenopsis equestris TaxID=78828 RepID=UPI0009E411CA|nr:elongator complex protein 5 [Phalaenopsis equestris]